MKTIRISFLLFLFFALGQLQAQYKEYTYDISNGLETPGYDETVAYCRDYLAAESDMVHYFVFGKSGRGKDLPCLIVDKNGLQDPEEIKKAGRLVLLVEACIHPGEPDGKDAGILLIRDIVLNNKTDFLDNVSLLFIPVFNVDGHERFNPFNRINQNGPKNMGWRANATNLNLNRDFVKADAPEMQAWLLFYNKWEPDFFVDCHTTDGADYQYVLTYAIETGPHLDAGLCSWVKNEYVPCVETEMANEGLPIFPYVSFRRWHDPRSGLYRKMSPPRLSQSYSSLRNCPGLLIETHMLKPYKDRVEATEIMLRKTMQILNKSYTEIKQLRSNAEGEYLKASIFEEAYPLDFSLSKKDSMMVDFLGVDYTVEKSDVTGGDWFRYQNDKPVTMKLPLFQEFTIKEEAFLPYFYVIPSEWSLIIERIAVHGVKIEKLKEDTEMEVELYRFYDVEFGSKPYESHQMVDLRYESEKHTVLFPAGSAVIDARQPLFRLIAFMLEPGSPDSFVRWGFMNAIFEQKEYGESYVMEEMAREMIKEDPELLERFEKAIEEDPSLAGNYWGLINWFYSKTPFWDPYINLYPVGRVTDESVARELRN